MSAARGFAAKERVLFLVAAALSLLFSALAIYQDEVINSDGIVYIQAAKAFANVDLREVLSLYSWPLYSLLMHVLHKATGIGLETSAQVINAIFAALLVVCFIALARELGGTFPVLVAAAVVVLAHPGLNEYRSYVIRDFGYWAFYLLALLLFVRYFRKPQWKDAAGWFVAMMVAALFRIEGILFLALLPLSLLFRPRSAWSSRVNATARAYVPHLVLALLAFALYWASDWRETGKLADLFAVIERRAEIASTFQAKADVLGSAILYKYSSHLGVTALWWALAGVLIVTVIKAISAPYLALAIHAHVSRSVRMQRDALTVIAFAVAINLLILATHLLVRYFLTGRFGVALGLVVMLAAPFSLVALYDNWRAKRGSMWVLPVVAAIIVYMAGDGFLSTGPSNRHIKKAGQWLHENPPPGARVYIDQFRVMFYADRDNAIFGEEGWEQTERLVTNEKWKKYDYFAVEVDRRNSEREAWLREQIGSEPVVQFGNERNDKILIFKIDRK